MVRHKVKPSEGANAPVDSLFVIVNESLHLLRDATTGATKEEITNIVKAFNGIVKRHYYKLEGEGDANNER